MSAPLDQELTGNKPNPLAFSRQAAYFWIGVFIVGFMFKVQHWPGAGILQIVATGGMAAIGVSSLIRFALRYRTIIGLLLVSAWYTFKIVQRSGLFEFNGNVAWEPLVMLAGTFAIAFTWHHFASP